MQKQIYYQYENKLHKQIIKLCHSLELPLHYNKKGPKLFTNYQRVGLIILFLRSKKSLIEFIKELFESRWPIWLSLKEIPGKSTLHDWMKLFNLNFLRKLIEQTVSQEKPSVMAIDATGIDSWQRSRHYERRRKQCGFSEEHMPYAKADVLVDTKKKLVYDFTFRIKPRHDVLGAKTIFKRLKVKNVLILGDKGYDAEELHQIAFEKCNKFYAPIRKSSRNRPNGRFRKKAFDNPPINKGMRSISETVIRSLKVRITSLRSKLHYMKKREFAWHIIAYNLKLILQLISELLMMKQPSCYSGCSS
jgi:hypothetical protein